MCFLWQNSKLLLFFLIKLKKMLVYFDKIINMLLWDKVILCLCFYSYDKTTQICTLKKFST